MKKAQTLNITWEELQACLARIKPSIEALDYAIIEALVGTLLGVVQALSSARVSIARLKRFFVGFRTEKSKDLLKKPEPEPDPEAGKSSPSPSPEDSKKAKPKRKGHGRLGADDYPGAERIPVPHKDLRAGCSCPNPDCKGKLHLMEDPSKELRIFGQPPLTAKIWEMEGLRCGLCQEVFRAETPEEALGPKYDATAVAQIGVLHFGNGMPYKRLEQVQRELGVPLPASDQSELLKKAGQDLLPAFDELKRIAAQDDVVYNDDTGNRVLSLLRKQRAEKASADKGKDERKGVFTTGIVATTGDRKIGLYFTGNKHAGENLDDLLERRNSDLEPVTQMSDGLDRNAPKRAKTDEGKCLTHSRRQFVDNIGNYPEECRRVIEDIGRVYHVDDLAKERNLSPQERLFLHQEKSVPIMEGLRRWLVDQLLEDKVEPNSGLGKAVAYMLRLWSKLTLFLRKPGAPLDTNIVERALKLAIRYRKNSLFFQTESGAAVGDLFMSLIETCWLNGINAFAYLVALLTNTARLAEHPSDWMPWNYQATLAALAPPAEPAEEQPAVASAGRSGCPRGPPSSSVVAQL